MNFNGLNNQHNFWGKWVQQRATTQYGVFCVLFVLALLPSTYRLFTDYQQQTEATQLIQTTGAELAHQQQILRSLQTKADTALLSPELTKQISPINGKIREFAQKGEFQQEWQMSAKPKLILNAESDFLNFTDFFTALLRDFADLKLISLHLEKAEQGIQSRLLLQLYPNQEAK